MSRAPAVTFAAVLALAAALSARPAPAAAEETAAPGGEVHGEGHGGGHRAPAFEWTLWNADAAEKADPAHDYGPGFLFALVNFVLLVLLLAKLLGKNVKQSVADRHHAVAKAIEDAESARRAAEARHAELERRLRALDQDTERLRDEVRAEAEREARHILERAKDRAERLAAEAERAVTAEVATARQSLEREVALAALAAATALVREKIGPDDKRRLEDEYLKQIS
ncbi:MAG TPA: hypothetical protein VG389_20490 [Myxococcota bacterium]|nr:hypothetical protein [Myxococcota bacterium]